MTNWLERSLPKRLAISTASSITTAGGVLAREQELVQREAQDVAVDRGHALEPPVVGLIDQVRVELGELRDHAAHEARWRSRGWPEAPAASSSNDAEHVLHVGPGDLVLVQHLQGELAPAPPYTHASTPRGAR